MACSRILIALALVLPATGSRINVDNTQSLMDAFAAGGDAGVSVSLAKDIELGEGEKLKVTSVSAINGNGFAIKARGADMFVVEAGGVLELEDMTLTFDSDDKKPNGCVVVEAGSFSATGVTFAGCKSHGDGAGVNAKAGAESVTIKDSSFEDCVAETGAGGAMCSLAAATLLTGTTFTNNVAKGHGAALQISHLGGRAKVEDCTFSGATKSARSTIYLSGLKELTFSDSTVEKSHNKGAGAVILSRLTDAVFSGSNFLNNERAIRAFQLFDGTVTFAGCTFEGNVADADNYAGGGAAIFVKESPHTRIVLKDSVFSKNVVDYEDSEGYGGALYLNADAEIGACTFEDNSADVGGAVYIDSAVSRVDFLDTRFSGNAAKVAGGAVAVLATSSEATFPGRLSFTGCTDAGNKVFVGDTTKSGGSFLKMNGGHLSLRDTTVAGTAGLRYAAAKLYEDVSLGGLALAHNADVYMYCGTEVAVSSVTDEGFGDEDVTTGFSDAGKFTVETHDSCPAAPGAVEDSKTWTKADDEGKTCEWVAQFPQNRCAAKDEDAVYAFEACKVSCGVEGKTCMDDASWSAGEGNLKDCAWAKRFINRCAAKSEDGVFGYEACAKSCHTCDASA